MVMVSSKIESQPLGLACLFFTVTIQLLGSMAGLGLVATYGISVLQK